MHTIGKTLTAAVLALTAVTAPAAEQPGLADVEQHTTQLSDTVYLIEPRPGLGGNLAVSVGDDGILLIDDQMMPLVGKIRAAIAALQEGGIDFVINTHYHFDHAGGNEAFGDESTIVAHTNVRLRLAEGREAGSRFIEGARPAAALPVITFDESVTFHWNGEDVDVIHLPSPSHTDGDAVIFFRGSNVIHTGDQYVNLNGFPYIDLDVGGSATGLRDNIARILAIVDDQTQIIPGHGPLATKSDVKAFHDLVAGSITHVEAAKLAGKTLEEIQAAGLPDDYKGATGFIPEPMWIASIFAGLP